jgi:hypothetical protein
MSLKEKMASVFKRFTMRQEIKSWLGEQPEEEILSDEFAAELIRIKEQTDLKYELEKSTDQKAKLRQNLSHAFAIGGRHVGISQSRIQ